jgi:hypothetical protein
MPRFLILTATACLLAAGCTSLDQPLGRPFYGFAAETNFEVQVVNRTPAPGAPSMDAEMANAAIKRYHEGKVKTGQKEEAPAITVNLPPIQ